MIAFHLDQELVATFTTVCFQAVLYITMGPRSTLNKLTLDCANKVINAGGKVMHAESTQVHTLLKFHDLKFCLQTL